MSAGTASRPIILQSGKLHCLFFQMGVHRELRIPQSLESGMDRRAGILAQKIYCTPNQQTAFFVDEDNKNNAHDIIHTPIIYRSTHYIICCTH